MKVESECPCQDHCHDFSPSESGNTCVHYSDEECWYQAYEDEEDEFEEGDKKLEKQEWETLDKLITKIGFGSYYDLIEMLRMTITNLEPKLNPKINTESDLLTLIQLAYILSKKKVESKSEANP